MPFSRFDHVVWGVALLLGLLIAGLVLFYGQAGLQVIEMLPGDDSAVSTRAQIEVVFDDAISAVADNAIVVDPPLAGSTRAVENRILFEAESALAPDTSYTVTLLDGVVGESGRTLKESVSWQFETSRPRILFLRPDENDPNQLFVANADGSGEPEQLTDAIGNVIDFAVSPDGRQIAYSALTNNDGQNATSDLWLMNADGTSAEMLLACVDAACSNPMWMPDGQRLLYERRNIPVPGAAPGNPRLWWLDAATGDTVPLFEDNQLLGLLATVSPDGEWLSFVSPTDQGVQLYRFADGEGTVIENQMGSAVAWHPDSRTVALADIIMQDQAWSVAMERVDVESGESTRLSESISMDDNNPVWSPDGSQLAFGRKESQTAMGRQIWVMDADGSNARALTDDPDIHHGNMTWSPDGQSIVYQRFNLKELYAEPSVWVLDVETGEVTEIAFPATGPAWLP